jgi:hypothetical protein
MCKPSLTVKQIVAQYLGEHGYDGLVNPGECGCQPAHAAVRLFERYGITEEADHAAK